MKTPTSVDTRQMQREKSDVRSRFSLNALTISPVIIVMSNPDPRKIVTEEASMNLHTSNRRLQATCSSTSEGSTVTAWSPTVPIWVVRGLCDENWADSSVPMVCSVNNLSTW
eukprot:1337551-Pyramimonas_sp.AAC.1